MDSNNNDLQESKAHTEANINEAKVTTKPGLKIEIQDIENLDMAKPEEDVNGRLIKWAC